ncbi:galactoside alpha-(1,2)-fucosyltransferase 1-like [Paramacrobiotus metropolitanus]|uniref:galactoside alpha-(1,2)-fucosyltransferase 1-like n=1 Tax=Paramacrobiotus metropolitanus TaxID=2943436 RepID=UPI0024456A97|nr:galactoside alpha-(1,2)-fucosyltransferase 1-like [Paramacrobiotus metropolitanus]
MHWFEGMDIGFIHKSVLFPNNSLEKHTLGDYGPGKFCPDFYNVNARIPDHAAALSGYGQSWKYFREVANKVRAMYTYKQKIQMEAINTIMDGLTSLHIRGILSSAMESVRVGMHVRRGDIVTDAGQRNHGHVAATDDYLLRMVLRVQDKQKNVVFFVISNDQEYCHKLFRKENFVFVEGHTAEVDMALMTFMDVVVLSVGSYGWWAAFLSDATDVYYFKDWPRNGSDFAKGVSAEDYFLPAWHGDN